MASSIGPSPPRVGQLVKYSTAPIRGRDSLLDIRFGTPAKQVTMTHLTLYRSVEVALASSIMFDSVVGPLSKVESWLFVTLSSMGSEAVLA